MGPVPGTSGLSPRNEPVNSSSNHVVAGGGVHATGHLKRDGGSVDDRADGSNSTLVVDAAASKKRKTAAGGRGVANLTAEQLAKKRANDREAQRAIRERTKNQIENLERRIQELTNLDPIQEMQKIQHSKELVEMENANIKSQLANIVGILQPLIQSGNSSSVSPTPVPSSTPGIPHSHTLSYHNPPAPANSASPATVVAQQPQSQQRPPPSSWQTDGETTSQAQPSPSQNFGEPIRKELENQRHHLVHGLDLGQERLELGFVLSSDRSNTRIPRIERGFHGAQDSPQYKHVPMKHDWTVIGPSQSSDPPGQHPHQQHVWEPPQFNQGPNSTIPLTTTHHPSSKASSPGYSRRASQQPAPAPHVDPYPPSPPLTDLEAEPGPQGIPRYMSPCPYSASTCPLDSLMLDFIAERRHRLDEGYPQQEVVGPRYPSVSSLLNPANSIYSHPLSKFFTDILSAFPDIHTLPERVAVLHIMFLLMRWQITPTLDTYRSLPDWIRPSDLHLTKTHPIWHSHLPFPAMRKRLTELFFPNTKVIGINDFFVPFTKTLTVSWPYEESDTLLQDPDTEELMINPVFLRHLTNLDNWKLGRQFYDTFPELRGCYNPDDELKQYLISIGEL